MPHAEGVYPKIIRLRWPDGPRGVIVCRRLLAGSHHFDLGAITVGDRNDDDRDNMEHMILLIMCMLAVISTYTDLVDFLRG